MLPRRLGRERHESRPSTATKAVKTNEQPFLKEIDMNAVKNAIRATLVAAAVVLSASAHAQDCSGGPDGGMDATGNQCSHSSPVAERAATPKMNPSAKTSATSRSVAAANRIAQPAKGPEPASIAPRAVKVSKTSGVN
jgi:hypothetical protein